VQTVKGFFSLILLAIANSESSDFLLTRVVLRSIQKYVNCFQKSVAMFFLDDKTNPMKVIVKVTRLTEYATVVEMTEERMNELNNRLQSTDQRVRRDAEKEANKLIDTKDWQDDDLHSVEPIEKFPI